MKTAGRSGEPAGDRLVIELGRLKEIRAASPGARAALERYSAGVSAGAEDADRKALLCALIDAVHGDILDEWTWTTISKADAKRQVMG